MIFDIESRPRPELVARFVKPFPAFDPAAVKFGNTRDQEKRAALVKEKAEAHVQEETAYWDNARERAALNPLTAEICCIGIRFNGTILILGADGQSEPVILRQFWEAFQNNHGEPFVFWSGSGNPAENFDPDFIIKRSWICGVPVPPSAFDGRYLGRKFVDAAARYLMFKREAYCSLTDAADQLGLYTGENNIFPKNKETDVVVGSNFHMYWDGKINDGASASDQRALAVRYLENDLLTADLIAARIL